MDIILLSFRAFFQPLYLSGAPCHSTDHAADLPLIPRTLDANALDDWGVDEDEDEVNKGFVTNAGVSVSGSGVSPAVPIPSHRRRVASGTISSGVGGLEGTRSGSAASPFAGEDFYQNSPLSEVTCLCYLQTVIM